jgi:anti-anti-sigma factor
MEIKVRQQGRVIILDLCGRVDANSANFIEAVGQCLRDGLCDILCNFEEVDFIDYMGISAIVLAYKDVQNNKGRMKFMNIPVHLKGLFSIVGLDRVIDICLNEELAINSFQEDKAIENIKKLQLRRRFKRLPLGIKAEISAKYDKNLVGLKVEVLNLSGIGAYLYDCDKFKLGDSVILKLRLPPKLEEVQLEAVVVWLSDKQIQLHLHPGMGIEFCNIPGATQGKLVEFIDRNVSFISTED